MIATPRLLLRAWTPDDLAPFAAMNADPRVMLHFPALLTEAETAAMMERNALQFERHGFGLWAVELTATREWAGFIGLNVPQFEAPFMPCVEIGWRLAAHFWNQGLATEGARAVLRFGFETLGLEEIVSFTTAGNQAPRRVMEKIGMVRDPSEDFEHPSLPEGHVLRRHVLYRKRRAP
ncbi:MAG: GNAT family N-acetyltransferase [Acidobacteriota bacterium]